MKREFLYLTTMILFAILISCNGSEKARDAYKPHLGIWSGIDSSGTKATIVFKKDGTGTIEFNNENYEFKYIMDYSKRPVWLDLIYPRDGKPYRAKLIVEFFDKNRLKWRTFFNEQRPEGFPPEDNKFTMVLTKESQGRISI